MNDFKEDKKNIRRGYNSVYDSCNLRLNYYGNIIFYTTKIST